MRRLAACPARRLGGASDDQLRVVAEARPGEFVGTKRLEEVWPGYGWRSALDPAFFRSPSAPRTLRAPRDPKRS